MKITRNEGSDGRIELQVTATAEEVREAIRFIDIQIAMQSGIAPQSPEDLVVAIKEEIGEDAYASLINYQVMQFLAPFAVTQEKLAIIGVPRVTTTGVTVIPDENLDFTVEVILKPTYEIDDYSPVKIKVPRAKVAEHEIDQQLVMIAERYATFEKEEDRPVRDGDNVMISLVTVDEAGEEVKVLTVDKRLYPVGKEFLPRAFDKNLIGMEVGETKTFDLSSREFERGEVDDSVPTRTFTFTATVLELQKRVIPAITDGWVADNVPDASTVPELREEIRKHGLARREQELTIRKSILAATEFAKRFEGSIPEEFCEMAREEIVQNIQQNLMAQGKMMQDFIEEQGGRQQFSTRLTMQAQDVLKQSFSLDTLARHLALELTDEDIEATFRLMAPGHEKEARMEFEATGRMYQIHEGALRNKANAWLVETADIEYVD
jgi:trigger factor